MQKTKNPLIFIFITVLIDCIGVRIIYPVAASIIAEVSHSTINQAVTYNGWMMAVYAIMQFVFAPLLGGLSDKFGRRPVLLLSLFGLGIDYLFLAMANTLPLLFLGRIIAGICGASLTAAFAYVADITPPEKRAQNFGLISSAVGLGFIIGPFLGGFFSQYGTRVPFIVAAVLSLVNWLYGFFILPESLKPENKRIFDIKRANPLGSFVYLKNNKPLRNLFIILFFIFLAAQVMPSIWPFYTKFLFKWSDLEIGYSLAFVGVMVALVKGGFVKWTQQKLGQTGSVYFGLTFNALGLILFAFATQSWMIYAITFIYCLGGIAQPSIQAIISSKTPDNEQGELQGTITSLLSLSNVLSPLIMTNLFYFFTKANAPIYFPGIPFALAALLIVISLLFFVKKGNNSKFV